MRDHDPPESRFAETVTDFCRLVEEYEAFDGGGKAWLHRIGSVMLGLDQAIQPLLRDAGGEAEYSMLLDLEARFALYQRLKSFLGPLDDYWSEGDLEAGDGLKTGSLADDITDVYFDLKRGLNLYSAKPAHEAQALSLWVFSYRIHWEQHLRDATKQLFEFKVASSASLATRRRRRRASERRSMRCFTRRATTR